MKKAEGVKEIIDRDSGRFYCRQQGFFLSALDLAEFFGWDCPEEWYSKEITGEGKEITVEDSVAVKLSNALEMALCILSKWECYLASPEAEKERQDIRVFIDFCREGAFRVRGWKA